MEETPSRWYLVLPAAGGSEIPDEQLDAVSGGLSYPTGLLGYAATLMMPKSGVGAVGPRDMPRGVTGPCDRPRGAVGPCN